MEGGLRRLSWSWELPLDVGGRGSGWGRRGGTRDSVGESRGRGRGE